MILKILNKTGNKYRIKFEDDPNIYNTTREGLIYYQNRQGYTLTGIKKPFIDPMEWAALTTETMAKKEKKNEHNYFIDMFTN